MRLLILVLALAGGPSAAAASARPAQDRDALIAALEQLIATGEPYQTSHDDGELLQRALDEALKQPDSEIERLAARASAVVDARLYRPIITFDDNSLPFLVRARVVLTLPQPVRYTADIFGSFDGGELVMLGQVESGAEMFAPVNTVPGTALLPGPHHLRLRVLIRYLDSEGANVPEPEYRDLRELVYAVFDREAPPAADARVFLYSPMAISARQLDRLLPDVPFDYWMNALLASRGEEPLHEFSWMSAFCDERERAHTAPQGGFDLCAVLRFQVGQTIGEIWFRTGRVRLSDEAVQWLATTPRFEAMRLRLPGVAESYQLSDLESLLDSPPGAWPVPDASLAPEDIVITPLSGRPNAVHVSAIIRNIGRANLTGLFIEIGGGDLNTHFDVRHFVRDIPRHGSIMVEADVTYPKDYGAVIVLVMPGLSDFGTWVTMAPDEPTPENNLTFRIINPKRSPAGYAKWIASRLCTAVACRGY